MFVFSRHLALRLYLVYRIDPFLTITELYKVSTMTLLQMCVDFLDSAPLWHFDQFFSPFHGHFDEPFFDYTFLILSSPFFLAF